MDGLTNAPEDTAASSEEAARAIVDVIPQVMQALRTEMRRRRGPEISVLQFRALAYLRRNPGATLSRLAEHVGLTLPSMSSQVSGLVARSLIDRSTSAEDRRYVTLTLTEQGRTLLETARRGTQASMAQQISELDSNERALVIEAMHLLARVYGASHDGAPMSDNSPKQKSQKPKTA